jgi:DNA-binding MarR family transcriptional regulator
MIDMDKQIRIFTQLEYFLAHYANAVSRETMLSNSQALIILRFGNGMRTVGDVENEIYSKKNCSYNISRLVSLGYLNLSRSINDGRFSLLTLTESGLVLREKIRANHEAFWLSNQGRWKDLVILAGLEENDGTGRTGRTE